MRIEGLTVSLVVLLLVVGLGAAAPAAEPSVEPMGVFPFVLPGLPARPDGMPRVLLWCRGPKLLGLVVAADGQGKVAVASQSRPAPIALLLRDGRCEPDGSGVSFGFLLPLKAWVFESQSRTPPAERTTWLLHRFEGSARAGQLKGTLVQVDVNHPGYAFRKSSIEVDALTEAQASFADENGWLGSVTQAYSLERSDP